MSSMFGNKTFKNIDNLYKIQIIKINKFKGIKMTPPLQDFVLS